MGAFHKFDAGHKNPAEGVEEGFVPYAERVSGPGLSRNEKLSRWHDCHGTCIERPVLS